jgi:disulfide bond formation protein DsbB
MQAPAIILVVGLATILGAWAFQLIGGYQPCALCLEERLPYYVGVPLALVALLAAAAGAKPTVPRMFLMVAGLVFAYNVYLGGYHAGAEWGWWPGPTDCAATSDGVTGTTDILAELETIKVVSCTEVQWRFLFLSFAGWNVVVSLFLVAVAFWGAFRPLRDAGDARPGSGSGESWATGRGGLIGR